MNTLKFYKQLFRISIFVLFFILQPRFTLSQSHKNSGSINLNGDSISASIGIMINSNGVERFAKSYDKLKKDDKFQLIIQTHTDLFLYLINEDPEKFQILYKSEVYKDSSFILPGHVSSYIVDGLNSEEKIIVLLSSEEINAILSYSDIEETKTELSNFIEKIKKYYKPVISENVQARINIGGNVRSLMDKGKEFKIYSGSQFVVKEYNFNVKK